MAKDPEGYLKDRAFKYHQRVQEHNNIEGERQVEQARETVRLQRANQEEQLTHQDLGRTKDWNRASIIQGIQQAAQTKAFNKSEGLHKRQLELNKQAAKGAVGGANNRRYERELENHFNKSKTKLGIYTAQAKLNAVRKEAAFEAQANFLEGIKNIGAAANNIGRSAVKDTVSRISEVAGKAAASAAMINSQESLFNLEILGLNEDQMGQHETQLSIERKHAAEIDKIGHGYLQATLQADAKRMAKPMMMPPIAKPEKLPRQEFLDPLPYKIPPHPVKGVGLSATSGAGGAGAGSGGVSGALNMAGATMGALATAGNIGAFGVTASFGPMLGPIGVGVMGLAYLGDALEWW
tara:strand:- start:2938 stop:3990 length:1053 start_codon:yes stop_codon:yes gene_type:complete